MDGERCRSSACTSKTCQSRHATHPITWVPHKEGWKCVHPAPETNILPVRNEAETNSSTEWINKNTFARCSNTEYVSSEQHVEHGMPPAAVPFTMMASWLALQCPRAGCKLSHWPTCCACELGSTASQQRVSVSLFCSFTPPAVAAFEPTACPQSCISSPWEGLKLPCCG